MAEINLGRASEVTLYRESAGVAQIDAPSWFDMSRYKAGLVSQGWNDRFLKKPRGGLVVWIVHLTDRLGGALKDRVSLTLRKRT